MMRVETRCPICGTEKTLTVAGEAWDRWKRGALVQVAFPELDHEDRERLITGICPKCWDEIAKEE